MPSAPSSWTRPYMILALLAVLCGLGTLSLHAFPIATTITTTQTEKDVFTAPENNVFGWGLNSYCTCVGMGIDDTYEARENVVDHPAPVTRFVVPASHARPLRIVQASVGAMTTTYLSSEGTVFTIGHCQNIGRSCERKDPYATKIEPIEFKNGIGNLDQAAGETDGSPPIVKASSISMHGIVLSRYGQPYVYGDNTHGQLGLGDRRERLYPTPIPMERGLLANRTAIDVCAGAIHSHVLTSDGRVFSFGENARGQLGHGNDMEITIDVPVEVQVGVDGDGNRLMVRKILCAEYSTLALTTDGQWIGWGDNMDSLIGVGNIPRVYSPLPVLTNVGVQVSWFSNAGFGRKGTFFHTDLADDHNPAYFVGKSPDTLQSVPVVTAFTLYADQFPLGIRSLTCSKDCCFAQYTTTVIGFCWPMVGELYGQTGNTTDESGKSFTFVNTTRVSQPNHLFQIATSTRIESIIGVDDPLLSCNGLHWSDEAVCNGHGRCAIEDFCLCENGWNGPECQHVSCNGIPQNDTDACYGNGECAGPDECHCDKYWKGRECNIAVTCFNHTAFERGKVCSGHGECIAEDICQCTLIYHGDDCEYLDAVSVVVFSIAGIGVACFLVVGTFFVIATGNHLLVCCRGKSSLPLLSIFSSIPYNTSIYNKLGNLRSGTILDNKGATLELSMISEQLIIPSKDIHIGQVLGNGSQATVFDGFFNGVPVALKIYRKSDFQQNLNIDDFIKEAELLASFGNHPYIVRLLGVCDMNTKIALVTELCENGSLAQVINSHALNMPYSSNRNSISLPNSLLSRPLSGSLSKFEQYNTDNQPVRRYKGRIEWETKLFIMLGVALGMQYLHSRDIVHRDLKAENILIDSAMRPRIADFGFSRVLETRQENAPNMTMNVGTSSYIAPELINDDTNSEYDIVNIYDEKCDVYSFGILLYCIIFETTRPYKRKSDMDVVVQVKTKDIRPLIEDQDVIDLENAVKVSVGELPDVSKMEADIFVSVCLKQIAVCIELMQRCWSKTPKKRPSFKEIVSILKNPI